LAESEALNPLLEEGGLAFDAPRFDRIEPHHFMPAFQRVLATAEQDIKAISETTAPADFENTIAALERAGTDLTKVSRIFWTISSAQSVPQIRAIEAEVSAMLTRYGTAISHNQTLFDRVRQVWEARKTSGLDPAQVRLVETSYRGFVNGGAALEADAKARFASIGEELAQLSTGFGQNVLAASAQWEMVLEESDLAGMPAAMRESAQRRAEGRGHSGKYLFTLDRGDAEGFLTFSGRRDLRERMWRAFTTRCDGGEHDNGPNIARILALRAERAKLLGYRSHAEYALCDSMAKTPDAAHGLMMRVWVPALRQAALEQAELEAIAHRTDGIEDFAPWDWRFYAEQVRRERYNLDGGQVKEHLTLERVRQAAFATARRLFGLAFASRPDLSGWHPSVQAWAVSEEKDQPLGLLYTDYFARPEKHGGAWMGSLRVQEKLDGPVLPIAYLVANFAKASGGDDAGLSIDEARTLFHEFGHALHALLSNVTYPSQAGTAVARDFVEFPSKFMEHWIVAPETLEGFGVPAPLITAIGHADDFGQGFATIEFLASAIVDLTIHSSEVSAPDAAAIAAKTLAVIGMPKSIAPRHGLTHFTHIFDGGYAGAYYSYLWSEVLDADAFAAFRESGDIFDRELANRYREEILGRGDSRDPMESFVAFRGRPPDERPLLEERRLLPQAAE
jgi:peptidyl-dipeptidase Dcp